MARSRISSGELLTSSIPDVLNSEEALKFDIGELRISLNESNLPDEMSLYILGMPMSFMPPGKTAPNGAIFALATGTPNMEDM